MTFAFDGWTAAFGLYLLGCFMAASYMVVFNHMRAAMTKEIRELNSLKLLAVCLAWPFLVIGGILFMIFGGKLVTK